MSDMFWQLAVGLYVFWTGDLTPSQRCFAVIDPHPLTAIFREVSEDLNVESVVAFLTSLAGQLILLRRKKTVSPAHKCWLMAHKLFE